LLPISSRKLNSDSSDALREIAHAVDAPAAAQVFTFHANPQKSLNITFAALSKATV
jgi:hypothetical protein